MTLREIGSSLGVPGLLLSIVEVVLSSKGMDLDTQLRVSIDEQSQRVTLELGDQIIGGTFREIEGLVNGPAPAVAGGVPDGSPGLAG